MTNQSTKWMKSMIRRYGSEEAVRAEMQRRQEKSMLNQNKQKGSHRGGFNMMSPEQLSEVSKKGAQARWRGHERKAA